MVKQSKLKARDAVWDHVKIVKEAESAKGKPTIECNFCDIKPFCAGRV